MKLIIREYLASLREREELDAILPDLLSELGFNVYSRPRRGTTQHGVDIAAVGQDATGERKVYLFSIKQGDLTRKDWDGSVQALRPSINEILDVYIPNHIPLEFSDLRISICLCFGGDMQEQVRAAVSGYIRKSSTDQIGFEEWNGDKIAGHLVDGVLREELLPKPLRSYFQKSVALLDEPDIAYRHFSSLLHKLQETTDKNDRTRTRMARQIYICVWVMFVWGRDIENTEAPYRASELAILNVWELLKPLLNTQTRANAEIVEVLSQLMALHLRIAGEFLERHIAPHCKKRDALAMAVGSQSSIDVNIKLFELLGRIGMTGMWLVKFSNALKGKELEAARETITAYTDTGLSMIESNSALWLPIADSQSTDIAIFLMLCAHSTVDMNRVALWIEALVSRYEFTVARRGRYPTSFEDYRALIDHPRNRSDDYFRSATTGSTLIPLIAAWSMGIGRPDLAAKLSKLAASHFDHCTMQLWSPDEASEEHLYVNSDAHGRAICDLPVHNDASELVQTILTACEAKSDFESLSAIRTGFWPIALLACLHWRLPIPPDFWIRSLVPSDSTPTLPIGDITTD